MRTTTTMRHHFIPPIRVAVIFKKMSVSEDRKKLELLCMVSGNRNWYRHGGIQN